MKKLFTSILLVLLLAGQVFALGGFTVPPQGQRLVASGSIAANLAQLDLTATNAFAGMSGVDLSAYQDGNHILQITNNTTGYSAYGYISDTAPGGLTKSAALLTGWTNSGVHPYETFTTVGANITSAINDGTGTTYGLGNSNKISDAATGKLFIAETALTLNSDTAPALLPSLAVDTGDTAADVQLSAGANTLYYTAGAANFYWNIWNDQTATNFALASTSIKQVTDVAITGALIVSAHGGATRAWPYVHASFNPNAASTYKVFNIGN